MQTYTFANNGNITSKTGIGAYKYDPVKLHAVVEVENTTAVIPTISQFITYAAFQQPMTITEGTNVLTYTYSADYQRIKGVLSGNAGATLNKRYYFGDFERDITGAVTRDIHYIGADGLNCVLEKIGTNVSYYYVYKDYLGSILTVTNAAGSIVEEKNFDAWGKNRNPTDWTYNNVAANSLSWLTRGYTGHEHLVHFGLINMNGRLYDPILGRMLSPDNYTQGGSQGYNRYTYAMNNPLKYTDPSGQVLVPILPIIAVLSGAANVWSNWQNISSVQVGVGYFLSGVIGGATVNPYTGAAITTVLNSAIALATGKLPNVKNFGDFLQHTGSDLAIAFATIKGAQFAAPYLKNLLNTVGEKFSSYARNYTVGSLTQTVSTAIDDFAEGVFNAELVVSVARRGPALQLANSGRIVARNMLMDSSDEIPKGLRNGHLAGGVHPKTNIPFDADGFPDFSQHLYANGPSDIMITPTGSRGLDFSAANEVSGYTSTPKGYTWHHHQITGRMQLVETIIHSKTGHTGGFALWRF